jgi:hypothetical protein
MLFHPSVSEVSGQKHRSPAAVTAGLSHPARAGGTRATSTGFVRPVSHSIFAVDLVHQSPEKRKGGVVRLPFPRASLGFFLRADLATPGERRA